MNSLDILQIRKLLSNNMKNYFKAWMLVAALWLIPVQAEESEQLDRFWDFGIGIGFGKQSNPFIGSDSVPGYITLDLALYGEKFFFDNGEFGYTVIDKPNFGFNILANYSSERIYYTYFNDLELFSSTNVVGAAGTSVSVVPLDRFNGTPSPNPGTAVTQLNLPDRDFAINVGLEFVWDTPKGQLQWQVFQDVSGAHEGLHMELDFSHTWSNDRWAFKPNVGLSWKSADLVDYYYGFDSSASTVGLSYEGEETTHINVGGLVSYRINNNLSYVNQIKYTLLGDAVRDSPLISEDHTLSYFSGIFYSF